MELLTYAQCRVKLLRLGATHTAAAVTIVCVRDDGTTASPPAARTL